MPPTVTVYHRYKHHRLEDRDPAKTNSHSDHERGVLELLPLYLAAPHAAALEAPLLERLLQDLFSRKEARGGRRKEGRTGRVRPCRIEYQARKRGGGGASINLSAEWFDRTSSIAGAPERS